MCIKMLDLASDPRSQILDAGADTGTLPFEKLFPLHEFAAQQW